MKAKCKYNTGKILLDYTRRPLGTSAITEYGELEIGMEYLVMGMIMSNGYLNYLIDSGGVISACPYQLFEVTSSHLSSNWYFRAFTKEDNNYVNVEAVWGYFELCFIDDHYEQLIEMKETAHLIYFKRKIEVEKELDSSSQG